MTSADAPVARCPICGGPPTLSTHYEPSEPERVSLDCCGRSVSAYLTEQGLEIRGPVCAPVVEPRDGRVSPQRSNMSNTSLACLLLWTVGLNLFFTFVKK